MLQLSLQKTLSYAVKYFNALSQILQYSEDIYQTTTYLSLDNIICDLLNNKLHLVEYLLF